MRSNAPKVKRNETMTLSDRKHFQNFEKNPKTGVIDRDILGFGSRF